MPANLKVIYTAGVPIAADFAASDGPPLCVNSLTGTVYYLAPGDVVTAISGGAGTVTSVGLDLPTTLFTVSGSPVTASGTIAAVFVSAAAGLFLATPSGSTDRPSLRAIVDVDVPDALTINGGTINNTVIGASTAAAATFTVVTATSTAKAATAFVSATATFANLVDISGASAGQIQFPATQNASSNANTFDDYEEGTWSPVIGGTATYTAQVGLYTKKGREVSALFYLVVNSIGTGSTTLLSGLPFANGSATSQVGYIGYFASIQHAVYFLGCYVNASASTMNFTDTDNSLGQVTAGAGVVVFQNAASVQGGITYTAAT